MTEDERPVDDRIPRDPSRSPQAPPPPPAPPVVSPPNTSGQLKRNAYCFSCGYDRSGIGPDLPCPECGKSPNAPRCTFCGYELTGLQVTESCPECGKPIWDSNIQPPTSGLSIASMVLGIVSLVSCMFYGIPAIVLGPLAIIFGEIAVRQHKKGLRAGNTKGFALTGRICGWAGLAIGGTFLGFMVWIFLVN